MHTQQYVQFYLVDDSHLELKNNNIHDEDILTWSNPQHTKEIETREADQRSLLFFLFFLNPSESNVFPTSVAFHKRQQCTSRNHVFEHKFSPLLPQLG